MPIHHHAHMPCYQPLYTNPLIHTAHLRAATCQHSSSANSQAPITHPSLYQFPGANPGNDSLSHQPPLLDRPQQIPQLQELSINPLYQNPPVRLRHTECIMDSLLNTLVHQQRVDLIRQAIRNRHSVLWGYCVDCNPKRGRDEGNVD